MSDHEYLKYLYFTWKTNISIKCIYKARLRQEES